jgi:shikimate dehydrogenase
VRALGELGFVGANVTVPHKEAALALADEASDAARAIGAANTLSFRDGTISAENTDAPALLAALPIEPAGKRALVLGAGGSARAAVWALRSAGASVAVWNRTPQRAVDLAAELGVHAVERAEPAELLVNCTTVGLRVGDRLKDLPVDADSFDECTCVVDFVYAEEPTALISAARERGVAAVDGLEILVRQGALSFELWTSRAAPLDAMRTAVAAG